MKKIINSRIALFALVGTVLGIICFHQMVLRNFWPLALLGALLIVAGVVLACFKRKEWIMVLLVFICAAIGFGNGYARYYIRGEDKLGSPYGVLRGRVTDIERNGYVPNVIYLENCTFEDEKIYGVVKVNVYDGDNYSTGDAVTCVGNLHRCYAIKARINTERIRYNICYEMSPQDLIDNHPGPLKLDEKVRKYMYEVSDKYASPSGGIIYALLSGDRNAISHDVYSAYQTTGTSHLLVVSGLHVGFLVTVFGFVLKRFKLNPLIEIAILLVPLLAYGYICRFSPSTTRAIVMTVCVYLTKFLRGQYDLMSSLCWAALFILTMQPLNLYDLGFEFSVLSVFGIVTVYLQFDRLLKRHKVNKWVVKLLSTILLSFSCIAATYFLSAYVYGRVYLWGLLLNVIAIPIVFVSFVLSVVGMIPKISAVLWLPDKMLAWLTKLSQSLKWHQFYVKTSTVVAAVAISVVLLLAVGGFIRLNKLGKSIFYPIVSAMLAVCIIVASVPAKNKDDIQVILGYNDSIIIATKDQNEMAIVGNFSDQYVVADTVRYIQGHKLCNATLYFTDFDKADAFYIDDLTSRTRFVAAYKLAGSGNPAVEIMLQEKGIPLYSVFPNDTVGENIKVESCYDGGLVAAVVHVGNIRVASVVSDGMKVKNFASHCSDLTCCVVQSGTEEYFDGVCVTLSMYQNDIARNFGANKYGNFTICEKDDIIKVNFWRRKF